MHAFARARPPTPCPRPEGYPAKWPRCYAALKKAGHSPSKALEILVDAKRGNERALRWVRGCVALARKRRR